MASLALSGATTSKVWPANLSPDLRASRLARLASTAVSIPSGAFVTLRDLGAYVSPEFRQAIATTPAIRP